MRKNDKTECKQVKRKKMVIRKCFVCFIYRVVLEVFQIFFVFLLLYTDLFCMVMSNLFEIKTKSVYISGFPSKMSESPDET